MGNTVHGRGSGKCVSWVTHLRLELAVQDVERCKEDAKAGSLSMVEKHSAHICKANAFRKRYEKGEEGPGVA
jgi:hypothetical protein